jgi:hypothetical protein
VQIYKEFESEDMAQFDDNVTSNHTIYTDSLTSQVPLVCGMLARDDISKMIFIIEEVETQTALIAY